MWPKGKTIKEAIVIGKEDGGLYRIKGHSEATLTHSIENPCELWHRRLAHINYKALPYVSKAVTGLPEFKVDHGGVYNGCAQGKNIKNPFLKRDNKEEGVLELIHSDVCAPMPSTSISGYVYYVSFIDDYSRKPGKYAVEILKRFDMLECKSMNTPMETKLKLLVDTSSELIDATLYR
jgi:hypothetical protein